MSDLDKLLDTLENESTVTGQRQALAKIQKGLISAQDIGDDKLTVVQAMSDAIENKTRMLEHDVKNLDFADEREDDESASLSGNGNGHHKSANGSAAERQSAHGGGGGAAQSTSSGAGKQSSGAKASKRQADHGKTDKQSMSSCHFICFAVKSLRSYFFS